MKYLAELLQLSLAIIVTTILFACSPVLEKTQQNDFFEPVDRIEHKKAESDTLVLTRESDSIQVDDGLKDSLIVTGANVVPVQPAPAQQVPVLITGAKAIPVQTAPVQQVSVPRQFNTSLNYEKAIKFYKSKQYRKAIGVFEKLLNQKIEPKLADHYHFWMGVCYLNLNKSNQAIKEFTDVLEYTNSDKVEEAYFMIGQCYERIGAKKSAIMTYEKMLRIYPQGNLKQVAEKKLALLK